MRYIAELREGEMISETYLCKQKQALKTKAGKNYYSLLLQDKTGILDAKIWDLGAGIDHFEQMEYIHVDGQVISFQGSPQLNIKRLRRSQEGEYDPADFMPMTERNIDEMYHELISLAGKVRDPFMRALVSSFFIEDKEFAAAFCRHSAAKTVHHGFIGGLLEHTLGVMRLCDYMADRYPVLNRDLLLASALFHDIGKLKELSYFPENDYTDEGQLLGHIYMGAEMVSERIRRIPDFPQKMANEIIHCILAHHGELEYGSPKKPALAEALALNLADNADAKMQSLTEIFKGKTGMEWLGFNRLFESNLRRTSGA